MPKIEFEGREFECEVGDNLRRVLMRERSGLYNGPARFIHCRGLGTCGTCAIEVDGAVSAKTGVENWRLGFPPHKREVDLRLACQCLVEGDLRIIKHDGLWGHKTETERRSGDEQSES